MEKNEEVEEYFRRTTGFDHSNTWRSNSGINSQKVGSAEMKDRKTLNDIKIDNITQENWR